MDAVEKATRAIEAQMPVAPVPVADFRAVAAGLVETLASFRTLPFVDQRSTLKRIVRPFQVVDDAIPDVTLSGAFLAHTNSRQHFKMAVLAPTPMASVAAAMAAKLLAFARLRSA